MLKGQKLQLNAVKINALYTLLVQFNVALKCFTVQLQKSSTKTFFYLMLKTFAEI